jgi:hypothetical protein
VPKAGSTSWITLVAFVTMISCWHIFGLRVGAKKVLETPLHHSQKFLYLQFSRAICLRMIDPGGRFLCPD